MPVLESAPFYAANSCGDSALWGSLSTFVDKLPQRALFPRFIAAYQDFETIKSILACTKILNEAEDSKAYITSVIYGRENEDAARITKILIQMPISVSPAKCEVLRISC